MAAAMKALARPGAAAAVVEWVTGRVEAASGE
jgi:hypothetical protein